MHHTIALTLSEALEIVHAHMKAKMGIENDNELSVTIDGKSHDGALIARGMIIQEVNSLMKRGNTINAVKFIREQLRNQFGTELTLKTAKEFVCLQREGGIDNPVWTTFISTGYIPSFEPK
jgi:hypothetical protein